MQRGTAITLSSTNLISPCTRSDGYTNGQNETSFAASKFSVLVLMEKYDKLFLDTEKMSYFSVSVSVFRIFPMTICVNFLLIAFALRRIFALIWHFSCFGKVAKFRVGHGHGLAQVFHFSWVLEQSQEKLKTMLIQLFSQRTKIRTLWVELALR